jgi:predicted metal-dependent phosphoesterase TrpH
MSRTIDLHTHSTASDGRLAPGELVARAASQGISVLALTDHDSVAGIDEAWSVAKKLGVTFIPGVELSTDLPEGECHILGYFLDHRSPRLLAALRRFQESRWERGRGMVERLLALGLPISWERVQALAQEGTVTRSHVAEALLEAGCIDTRQEAFERFIGRGGLAYLERHKLPPEKAIHLIRQAHGVPVLAHPTFVEPGRDWMADSSQLVPWPFLERLCEAGLLGLEAYYGEYSAALSARLASLAEHYGLIVTGGSDFHDNPETPDLGSVWIPPQAVSDLHRLAQHCGSPWVNGVPVASG